MDGLDNRKISWPIAGNPPEHAERVGKGTFLRASFLRAERKIRSTESWRVSERTERKKEEDEKEIRRKRKRGRGRKELKRECTTIKSFSSVVIAFLSCK